MRRRFGPLAVALLFIIPSTRAAMGGDVPLRYQGRIPSDFSVPNAMKSLYGNVDPSANASVASVPGNGAKSSSFEAAQKIDVHPFWVTSAKESDTTKIFLLCYATPDSQPFECHACAPLIDMAVFVRTNSEWSIDSVGRGVVVFGQWGHPPHVRVVRVGPHRPGIELRTTYTGQGETTTWASILAPWKGEIREALNIEIASAYDDCRDGGATPWYRHR